MFRQNTPIYDGVLSGENEKALILILVNRVIAWRMPLVALR